MPGIKGEGRQRVVIEGVTPQIDGGRFPVKRTVGERVVCEADLYVDGHDLLAAVVLFRRAGAAHWEEAPMTPIGNDRWRGSFLTGELGRCEYTVSGWIDRFGSWAHDLTKRVETADIEAAFLWGAELIEGAQARASPQDARYFQQWIDRLRAPGEPHEKRRAALDGELARLMNRYPDRRFATRYERVLEVVVDRERARVGAWYELFPRSCLSGSASHGTFSDCEARLPAVAAMGFDVLYLPPIHPIGQTQRKGPNNALTAGPEDPGSPWAIGSTAGGHKAVHPALGTLEDFRRLREKAEGLGLEIALDIAFQCSPDHPYVGTHPEWFLWRPDGSIQYAENPPKRYEDIYPLNFESDAWEALWEELRGVLLFWIGEGVRIFRVDNPHTKPFAFWEWVITVIREDHPDVLFLSEAFARPKTMYRLAKLGFNQSYTYFTWRNTKWELTHYLSELIGTDRREYFRPNFWPNTPDILSEYLQYGGRPAFMIRLILAATLSPSYGIYGPAFELLEDRARGPGSEEYLDSEKYQVRMWDHGRPESLKDFITRVNTVRRENDALNTNWNIRFYPVDNDHLLCYSRWSEDQRNLLIIVVDLDAYHTQAGWVELPLEALGIDSRHPYQMHELLTGARYLWHGPRNYVELDPRRAPAQIFRVRRRIRTEHDFEYFM